MQKRKFAEFDLAKALAILGLPFVHYLEFCIGANLFKPEALTAAGGLVMIQCFGPALFMMCMGFGMAGSYSYKRTNKSGIQFLIIAYVLNFCITTLPLLPTRMAGLIDYSYDYILSGIFGADIYVFVGWYCIFLGLMRKCKASEVTIAIVGVLLLAINSFTTHNLSLEQGVLSSILGNFVSVNAYAYFPLAGWSLFPTIGLILGNLLKGMSAEKYLLQAKRALIISLAAFIMLVDVLHMYDISALDLMISFVEIYRLDMFSFCLLALIAVIILSLICVIYNAVRENALERFLFRLAPMLLPFYVIQWLVTTVCNYATAFTLIGIYGEYEEFLGIGPAIVIILIDWVICLLITMKKGLSFTRFVLRVSDYTKWFKRKKKLVKA